MSGITASVSVKRGGAFSIGLRGIAASFLLVGCVAFLATATSARAATIKADTLVQSSGTGSVVQVSLTSSKTPSKNRKPKSVSVKAAGKTLKLRRVKAATASAKYSSVWTSGSFTGDYAAALNALNGKSVRVTVSSKSGKRNVTDKVTVQTVGGGGAGGGGVPLFTPPPGPLTGNDAFNYLSKYFLNSAFSDCQSVWPACAVEQRYVHCPSGAWEYHRNTPSSGSDIHAYNNFVVTGATVNADGSWAVSYNTSTGASYLWNVSTAGIATGEYAFGGSVEALGPMYWSQPAITWQEPAGACA